MSFESLATCESPLFHTFPANLFPGMTITPKLIRSFHGQGLKVLIRNSDNKKKELVSVFRRIPADYESENEDDMSSPRA